MNKIERWDVGRAIEEAKKIGVNISRPTVIRLCNEKKIGYQPTGEHGSWLIIPDAFMAIITGVPNITNEETNA